MKLFLAILSLVAISSTTLANETKKILAEAHAQHKYDEKYSQKLVYDHYTSFQLWVTAKTDKLQEILKLGFNPNTLVDGYGLLNMAIKGNNKYAIKLLLDYGADPFAKSYVNDLYLPINYGSSFEIAAHWNFALYDLVNMIRLNGSDELLIKTSQLKIKPSTVLDSSYYCQNDYLYLKLHEESPEGGLATHYFSSNSCDFNAPFSLSRLLPTYTDLYPICFYASVGRLDVLHELAKKGANPNVYCKDQKRSGDLLAWANFNEHSNKAEIINFLKEYIRRYQLLPLPDDWK